MTPKPSVHSGWKTILPNIGWRQIKSWFIFDVTQCRVHTVWTLLCRLDWAVSWIFFADLKIISQTFQLRQKSERIQLFKTPNFKVFKQVPTEAALHIKDTKLSYFWNIARVLEPRFSLYRIRRYFVGNFCFPTHQCALRIKIKTKKSHQTWYKKGFFN